MSYGFFFFLSLLLTLAVEIPVLLILANVFFKAKGQIRNILFWGVFANLFSLPYLWFVFPFFIPSSSYVLIGEILVVLIEFGILLKSLRIELKNVFILSLVTNVASYLVGQIIF